MLTGEEKYPSIKRMYKKENQKADGCNARMLNARGQEDAKTRKKTDLFQPKTPFRNDNITLHDAAGQIYPSLRRVCAGDIESNSWTPL